MINTCTGAFALRARKMSSFSISLGPYEMRRGVPSRDRVKSLLPA
jgi:hypothetical protein